MSPRLTIFWMYVIGFLRMMYIHIPIYTLFLADHQISIGIIVFAAVFYSLGQFVFEVPTGIFADLFGQRLSLILGFFVEAMGLFLILLFPTPVGLCLSYLCGGIAGAFLSGSEEALIYENVARTQNSYTRVYANYTNSQTIGMLIANIVGGGLFALFGSASFSPLILTTAISLTLCSFMAIKLHEPHKPSAKTKVAGSKYLHALRMGFLTIKQDKLLKTMMIVSMLIIPGEYFLYNVYQPIFVETSVHPIWFGLAISAGMLLNIGLTAMIGRMEKRWTLEQILGIVTGLCGIFYLGLTFSHSVFFVIVPVIGILGLVEIYRPVVSDYVNERIASEHRVTVLSSIAFTQRVASAGLRLILSLVILSFGVRAGTALNGIYLLIGAVLSWWLLVRCGCTHRLTRHPVPSLPENRFS